MSMGEERARETQRALERVESERAREIQRSLERVRKS